MMKCSTAHALALTLLLLCIMGGFGHRQKGASKVCPETTTKNHKWDIGSECNSDEDCKGSRQNKCCPVCGKFCVRAGASKVCPETTTEDQKCEEKVECNSDEDCKGSKKICCPVSGTFCVHGAKDFSHLVAMFDRRPKKTFHALNAHSASSSQDAPEERPRNRARRIRDHQQ